MRCLKLTTSDKYVDAF